MKRGNLHIALISLHGLIRAHNPELGRDADTGGQVTYVLALAEALARHPSIAKVDLLTRQVIDKRISNDYAQLEEIIAPCAKIVRIPFGPKRYLHKEALWPYLELFIDQAFLYFRRFGLPDLIHAHYADGGYCGAQLARLFHIPLIFTGHSLGRVKQQRLLDGRAKEVDIEKKYRFSIRNEAEEIALETASLIVTSTNQEIEEQYGSYEYKPLDRMEVIPPGVDLSRFRPPRKNDPAPPIIGSLQRFLQKMDKPMILAIARPNESKNLERLVLVYGKSAELQQLANLVLLMGTRKDLRTLNIAQRRVVTRILTLIDVHDLYGKIAYPKDHRSEDIADLYRLAASLGGVFINPSLNEPFGLTLIEAAASGLPIIATKEGGPQDIIANCKNGQLIDPLDERSIEQSLLRALREKTLWNEWSQQGISGVQLHYSWTHHVDRYLRDVMDILEGFEQPAILKENGKKRRIQDFDRLLITDLDNTLTGDEEGLRLLLERLQAQEEHIGFGIATGRCFDDAQEIIQSLHLPLLDILTTSVGTELYYGDQLLPDVSWRQQIVFQWKPQEVRKLLDCVKGLWLQSEREQSEFKISYKLDPTVAPSVKEIRKMIRKAGLRVNVILSLGSYLDIIPVRGGSGFSMRHLLYKWGFTTQQVLVAGDSGNDAEMLKGRTLGVVVGNYSSELEELKNMPRIYFAKEKYAKGILEGIDYYHFLDHIIIPNDTIE